MVVTGEELTDYLIDKKRRIHMHPEMQAELEFGVEQSRDVKPKDIAENLSIFLEHERAWERVDKDIVQKRAAGRKVGSQGWPIWQL